MDDAATTVSGIEVERTREVRVTFGDGHLCRFGLEDLRVNCPCATCRGQRDAGQVPWPRAGTATGLSVIDAELVGAWGISFTWSDGHATGIYPWTALRRWCDDAPEEHRP